MFWVSSPAKQLSGSARVENWIEVHPDKLWTIISDVAGVSREEFNKYYEGASSAVAFFLTDAQEFNYKPNLSTLRHNIGFHPPQSFRYASSNELEYFENSEIFQVS